MAIEYVDSTQLDSDLTSVANAIRAKSGGSGQLAFPSGFVSEIGNIPSGGGWTTEGIMANTEPNGRIETNASQIKEYCLNSKTRITSFFGPSTELKVGALQYCTGLVTAVVGRFTGTNNIGGASNLEALDFVTGGALSGGCLAGNAKMTVMILRKSAGIVALANQNALSSTPFKSGGIGGTIYIPKVLYDHLGDNSALDYKKASNWSVYDGYGTITWAKIEGSYYETHYADGTAIS